jgi:hypothetical protein
LKNSPRKGGKVLKNLTPEGGKVLKKSSGKGPYVLRTDIPFSYDGSRLSTASSHIATLRRWPDATGAIVARCVSTVEDASGISRKAGNNGSCIRHAVLVFSASNVLSMTASTSARTSCGMSSRMVVFFRSAVCACRPSRNCVPSARPGACQGREPRRGWSEAESLDRLAASRTFAVVMAGVIPFVSFRSGIGGRRHVHAFVVRARRDASNAARTRAPA